MTEEGKKKTIKLGVSICIVALIAVAIYEYSERNLLRNMSSPLTQEEASSDLTELLKNVDWTNDYVSRRVKLQLGQQGDLKATLPNIAEFGMVVAPAVSSGDVAVEIFVSSEKSGKGTDGWMVEAANAFNAQNKRLGGGSVARIKIRKIASGTGYQFIASRKYLPEAFSPSNHLWIQMAAAHGVNMTLVREKLVGNIAGIVMKTSVAEKLDSQYGSVGVKNVIDAVFQGDIVMGYTNPFASSTGLNFLVTVLSTFSEGVEANMLSPAVVSTFEGFQRGVPFIAMTTLQMRDSVEQGGSLDAFVMEYQTFIKTPALQSGYEFIPFGIRHDNPLYAVGDLSPEEMEVLELFASFTETEKFRKLADEYGFNPSLPYEPAFSIPAGSTLVQAQDVWKEKKDAGRPIAAVFLSDVSGSMAGTGISGVRDALIAGSEFIGPENSIGLVVFSSRVRTVLPVGKFDLNHKAAFLAAVEDMDTGGKTAMYDGIAASLSLLLAEKKANPDVKPILFVLTDGETSNGLKFGAMAPVIEGIKIPVYTIGYEANLAELKRLSSLVEAASINANEGNVNYKIGSLLNAQM